MEHNFAYSKRGEIISSTKSSSYGDYEFTLSSDGLNGLGLRDNMFIEFRYELDEHGRITKMDMGRSAEQFDAMIEYEYDEDGNMTLAEYSSIRPVHERMAGLTGPIIGPVFPDRMINTYDEFGRLSKTEFNNISSGAQTIYQYSYDCRSYQSSETFTN